MRFFGSKKFNHQCRDLGRTTRELSDIFFILIPGCPSSRPVLHLHPLSPSGWRRAAAWLLRGCPQFTRIPAAFQREESVGPFNAEVHVGGALATCSAEIGIGIQMEIELRNVITNPTSLTVVQG